MKTPTWTVRAVARSALRSPVSVCGAVRLWPPRQKRWNASGGRISLDSEDYFLGAEAGAGGAEAVAGAALLGVAGLRPYLVMIGAKSGCVRPYSVSRYRNWS